MATLNKSALQRIGAAVRGFESDARRRNGARDNNAGRDVMIALVTAVMEDNPSDGDPYVYEADIFTGLWDDSPTARTAIVTEAVLYSKTELEEDATIGAVRVGEHWEALGGVGVEGTALPDGVKKGDIVHWDATANEWVVSEVGEPAVGDVVVWDGSKYVKKPINSLIKYDKDSHQLQVLVGSTWTMITGGQAEVFP